MQYEKWGEHKYRWSPGTSDNSCPTVTSACMNQASPSLELSEVQMVTLSRVWLCRSKVRPGDRYFKQDCMCHCLGTTFGHIKWNRIFLWGRGVAVLVVFLLFESQFLCRLGWPGTCYVFCSVLELSVWIYSLYYWVLGWSCMCCVSVYLEVEPMASCIFGKYSTLSHIPSSCVPFYFICLLVWMSCQHACLYITCMEWAVTWCWEAQPVSLTTEPFQPHSLLCCLRKTNVNELYIHLCVFHLLWVTQSSAQVSAGHFLLLLSWCWSLPPPQLVHDVPEYSCAMI